VQNNTFGVRPNGRPANGMPYGVSVQSATAIVRDNTFRNMTSYGVFAQGPTGYAKIFGNTFTGCECAVEITNFARGLLGSLGNKATDDDGGNIFDPSNTMFIQNFTTKAIRAEGNDFGTISKAEINAKIIDREDYPTFSGRVDFTPLAGGVVPTGAILAVTGASAVPVGSGAEIIFTLSTAADVTVSVLNIAGRPVATVARDVTTEGGLQRMVWSGHADGGLAAPAGQYLVRVEAREPSGQRAQILAAMRITR
jgi:hypothetical protein